MLGCLVCCELATHLTSRLLFDSFLFDCLLIVFFVVLLFVPRTANRAQRPLTDAIEKNGFCLKLAATGIEVSAQNRRKAEAEKEEESDKAVSAKQRRTVKATKVVAQQVKLQSNKLEQKNKEKERSSVPGPRRGCACGQGKESG